jgi:hypothetical protein
VDSQAAPAFYQPKPPLLVALSNNQKRKLT